MQPPSASDTFQPFLAGEVALVSGASRGIGQAMALEFARLGADVGLVQRGDAAETRAGVEALGRRAHVVQLDLADAEGAQAAVEEVVAALGRLDVLVANAAAITRTPAIDLALDDFRRVIDVSLVSVFALCQAAARSFLAAGRGGRIVTVGSLLSFQGGIRIPAYAAAKGGVGTLTKALANEWAPLGIRVNAVAPGYIETEQTVPLREDAERFAELSSRIPLGRWGVPGDVVGAVVYLVSPAAAYVHGHLLAVDGGWLGR